MASDQVHITQNFYGYLIKNKFERNKKEERREESWEEERKGRREGRRKRGKERSKAKKRKQLCVTQILALPHRSGHSFLGSM